MATVRPRYLPFPSQDAPESGQLILRDGSTAAIWILRPKDKEALARFFASLSSAAKFRRFFSATQPSDRSLDSLLDNTNPHARLTLGVSRLVRGEFQIIAVGSYVARDQVTAEMAVEVDDRFQGKGIGTLLLERLALMAVMNGFRRFWAVTTAENKPMLDVFRNSGFELHTKATDGYVEIDLSVIPSEASVTRAEMRDRISTAASLRSFFRPRSVAVIGASRNPNSIGARLLNALVSSGFQGSIYPINPNASTIASLPSYPSMQALPQDPDLAVITVPPTAVLGVIDDCAARGVKSVVVITAGFAEIGPQGRELQQKLVERARGYGMRIIGPNCLGLLNAEPAVRLNASFAPHFPPSGQVAFCSQSGALGLAIIALARERQLGLSSFVSVGNKADVSGNDLLQYWEEDKGTHVILLYLESFGNPRRFARIARRVGLRKPIVALKAGRTGAGLRAASSHTAALAASDVAVEALFHQTGVTRAETIDEMFDVALALDAQPLPKGRRVGILTNAGGLGILCADSCEANGLMVQPLQEKTMSRLRQFLPATASIKNPVDMIAAAGADEFRQAVEILLSVDEIDSLIVLAIDVGLADMVGVTAGICKGVTEARMLHGAGKTVLVSIMDEKMGRKPISVNDERLPNYAFPENAARVLGKLANYSEWRSQREGMIPEFNDIDTGAARAICQSALAKQGDGWLSAETVRRVLAAMALPLPDGGFCRTVDEAVGVASRLGFPVAVKLASRQIVHKTDAGGVRLNLQDESAVRQAFTEIQNRLAQDGKLEMMDGVVIQPMISGGVELMVGVTQDPSFGPLLGFGLGGIHVEILKDVSFRVAPITDRDAREMIRSLKGYRLLEGYRGHPSADIAAIETLLLRVSRLVEEVPEIAELDLNPVMALPPGQGCLIVDARISLKAEKTEWADERVVEEKPS
ncbi:MAG TPA: GNAT family N-acetyltransferase [Candidatus Binatia bacterium]|nr:GNAT family N-acetyltransferase [Candidatus Binatia bacterium]